MVAGVTFQVGIGMEIGASVTGTLFPLMKNLESLDGKGFAGFSASGGWLGRFEMGASKSNGYWGSTVGAGVGYGGHVSVDIAGPSKIKTIKWKEIHEYVSGNTEESKKVQAILNIGNGKNQNTVEIVKDYLANMATTFRNKRINDLNKENENNESIIKTNKHG